METGLLWSNNPILAALNRHSQRNIVARGCRKTSNEIMTVITQMLRSRVGIGSPSVQEHWTRCAVVNRRPSQPQDERKQWFYRSGGVWLVLNFPPSPHILNSINYCVYFENEGQHQLPNETLQALAFKFRQKTKACTVTTSSEHYSGVLATLIRLKLPKKSKKKQNCRVSTTDNLLGLIWIFFKLQGTR